MGLVSRVMTGAPFERGFWGATLLTVAGAAIAIQGGPLPRARTSAGRAANRCDRGQPVLERLHDPLAALVRARDRPAAADLAGHLRRRADPVRLSGRRACTGARGSTESVAVPSALGYLAIAAAFCSAISVVAWNIGVGHLGVQVGGLWQNTVPLWSVLISTAFFGFHPLPQQLLGAAS
jgi:hypothetical protein